MDKAIIITCEHAGNQVPEPYRHLFNGDETVLQTHRGYDIGALELAETCADMMQVEPIIHHQTRLLVDLNRSLQNPSAFSEYVNSLDEKEKRSIVKTYYEPHRKKVENAITDLAESVTRILHLSVHTFTPVMDEKVRDADIGLLFDPERSLEKKFCEIWKSLLEDRTRLKVRFNYPYPGKMDGLSTYLRTQFPPRLYTGIEIEVNQKFPQGEDETGWNRIQQVVGETLRESFEAWS